MKTSCGLLYHLPSDVGEKFDVAAKHTDILAEIDREVQRHRATLTPAPNQLEATVPAAK